MNALATSQPIVVGIDGSNAAIRAALWAVDEAVGRDVPLRLLYVIDQGDARQAEPETMARKLATAETAIHRAVAAIEGAGQPVKIETDIAQGPPVESLIAASASAAMVCVGAVGLLHFRLNRVGSTTAALAISARCPVAIIREPHNRPRQPVQRIIVDIDKSPDTGVLLRAAVGEATLRNATFEAIICRRIMSIYTAAEDERVGQALADLDRRLVRWKHQYPHLGMEPVAVHSTFMEYLAYNCRSVQLVIVGNHDREHLKELIGPVGSAILQDADCALLVVNRQHL